MVGRGRGNGGRVGRVTWESGWRRVFDVLSRRVAAWEAVGPMVDGRSCRGRSVVGVESWRGRRSDHLNIEGTTAAAAAATATATGAAE